MKEYKNWREVVVNDLLKSPEETEAYLKQAVNEYDQDSDTEALLLALRTVAEAQGGISFLAKKIHMNRQSLYKALSGNGNPRLSTIGAILHGLGYRLSLEPVAG